MNQKVIPVARAAFLVGVGWVAWMWGGLLAPVKSNTLTVREKVATSGIDTSDVAPVSKSLRKPLMPAGLTSVTDRIRYTMASAVKSKHKTIAITEIVKDKRMLAFICHNQVLSRAFWVERKTGLSTAAVIGQKYSESGGGTSKFCAQTKCLSNIKCTRKECKLHNVKGLRKGQVGTKTAHCIQLYDDRPYDRFVRFDALYKGWEEYAALINKRYSKAASRTDVLSEVKGLKAGGFATNPRYVSLVYGKIQHTGLLKLQTYVDKGYTITTSDGRYVLLQQ